MNLFLGPPFWILRVPMGANESKPKLPQKKPQVSRSLTFSMRCDGINILLHDWAGNMGNIQFEGGSIGPTAGRTIHNLEQKISPYCPTQGTAIIYLLYDFERRCHGSRFSFF